MKALVSSHLDCESFCEHTLLSFTCPFRVQHRSRGKMPSAASMQSTPAFSRAQAWLSHQGHHIAIMLNLWTTSHLMCVRSVCAQLPSQLQGFWASDLSAAGVNRAPAGCCVKFDRFKSSPGVRADGWPLSQAHTSGLRFKFSSVVVACSQLPQTVPSQG